MKDVLIGFYPLMFFYLNGSGDALLSQVISQKVDDHGELCIFFGTLEEFLFHSFILCRVFAARSCPFDGPSLDITPFPPDEAFRRGRKHTEIPTVKVGIELGRIIGEKGAKE